MAYWVDDGFDTWPEVVRAGKAAAGLYICCGAWVARNIGNGSITEPVIPAEIATMYGTPEWVAKLTSVGLWRTEGAGYRDVRYHDMGNPTADVVRKRRADSAERQRRFREAKRTKRVTRDKTRDSRVSNGSSNGVSNASPPPSKEGEGARARAAGRSARPQTTQPRRTSSDENPHWRTLAPPDEPRNPADAERARRGAAAASAAIRQPTPTRKGST